MVYDFTCIGVLVIGDWYMIQILNNKTHILPKIFLENQENLLTNCGKFEVKFDTHSKMKH